MVFVRASHNSTVDASSGKLLMEFDVEVQHNARSPVRGGVTVVRAIAEV